MTTKYTDAPRTRVMTPASLNNGVHENHSIGQTMAIAPKKGLFDDISIPQIIAGAAAAATSVALASKIGIAGSVIGAAVSSVITVVSSQVYRHFISASAEALKGTHADDYPAGAYEPVEFNAEEHLDGAATTQEMRQIAGRATTARVAPNSLRAKAAAERSQTQKKVIVLSIAIAIVAVIACTGAILITTAGEGLGERPEPILSSRTTEHDADSSGQSQSQQDSSQGTSASTDSSSNTPDQSQGADSSVNNSGTQSGTTDSSQTTDGSQPSTGDQTSGNTSGTGSTDNGNTDSSNSSSGTASGTASDSSSQGTASGN